MERIRSGLQEQSALEFARSSGMQRTDRDPWLVATYVDVPTIVRYTPQSGTVMVIDQSKPDSWKTVGEFHFPTVDLTLSADHRTLDATRRGRLSVDPERVKRQLLED